MKMQTGSGVRALTAATLLVCAMHQVASAQTLPAPWSSSDVGAPALSGSATAAGGVLSVYGAGTDIWGTSDQFHFVYQALTGDALVLARVASITNTNAEAKGGVMIRESLTGNTRYAMMTLTAASGARFQRRPTVGGTTVATSGPPIAPPGWVAVVRLGDLFLGYASTDGVNWTGIGAERIPMGATVYVGLAATSRNVSTRTRVTFDNIRVIGASGNQSPAVTLTQPTSGTQVTAPATVTLAATATDPENRMAKVDFYVEGTMVASDTAAPYSATWTASAAGTYSLSAIAYDADGGSSTSSPVALTVVAASNGAPTVSLTSPANGATFTEPATILLVANATDPEGQLARVEFYSGTTLLGSDTSAPYAFTWSNVAAGTYSLTARAFDGVGLNTTSVAASVTVNAAGGGSLPAGQTASDVGSPAMAGQTTYSTGRYTVRAAGSDIWGMADQFHFVYQQMTGDAAVVARVVSIGSSDPWAKAGVMVRETLAGGSRNALMTLTAANGYGFQTRPQPNAATSYTSGGAAAAPGWVGLLRRGDTIQAFRSANGTSWTLVGTATVAMSATVYVGVAVTSHNASTATTAVIDSLQFAGSNNQPPTISLTSPANGATLTAPATVTVAASASDPENQLARVEFYAGSTLIITDTSAPFSFSASNVAAGTYSLTARAFDAAGASATSAPVSITVNAVNAPPTVSLTSPANGATFTAPAALTLSASASDPENRLARVEFYSGSTLIGTDTSAPFSFSWSNVAAGTYSLTARAFDTAGAGATSAPITVTVRTASSTAPATVVFTASTDHAANVTSYRLLVYGQGADPATATAVATSDLGKPAPAGNNDITVDRAAFFSALAPGNYVATVMAIGPGGQTQSTSVTFTR